MLKKCAPGKLLRLGLGLGLRLGLALTLTLTGKLLRAVLDKLFLASWLSLRLVWLPPLLAWLCLPCQVTYYLTSNQYHEVVLTLRARTITVTRILTRTLTRT